MMSLPIMSLSEWNTYRLSSCPNLGRMNRCSVQDSISDSCSCRGSWNPSYCFIAWHTKAWFVVKHILEHIPRFAPDFMKGCLYAKKLRISIWIVKSLIWSYIDHLNKRQWYIQNSKLDKHTPGRPPPPLPLPSSKIHKPQFANSKVSPSNSSICMQTLGWTCPLSLIQMIIAPPNRM